MEENILRYCLLKALLTGKGEKSWEKGTGEKKIPLINFPMRPGKREDQSEEKESEERLSIPNPPMKVTGGKRRLSRTGTTVLSLDIQKEEEVN